jgi:cyclic pyranopterin monophosphate synthase
LSMIDVTPKPEVYREAIAQGSIKLKPETVRMIRDGKIEKGDPLSVAKVAGILAAKNTSSLIPLCHPLPLTNVEVHPKIINDTTVLVEAIVKTRAQTGVEMEALTATSVALLTIWDMTKKYEKDRHGQYPTTLIESIGVVRKIKRNI